MILPLIHIGSLSLTISLLKQLILDQTRQRVQSEKAHFQIPKASSRNGYGVGGGGHALIVCVWGGKVNGLVPALSVPICAEMV